MKYLVSVSFFIFSLSFLNAQEVSQANLLAYWSQDVIYAVADEGISLLKEGQIHEKNQSKYTSKLPSGSYIIELFNGQQVYAQLFSITK